MPWLETAPMEQRERFIRDERLALYTMTELCERYGISRKTGYKWLARFDEGGRAGLGDRSRAPHQCPHRIADDVARLDLRGAPPASELGPRQAPALARAAASGHRLAGRQHRRRSAGPQGAGEEAPAAPSAPASGRGARRDDAAERPLDRRLQRAVSDPGRRLLLSADDRRSAHAILDGVSRPAVDERPRRPPRLRSAVSRVRAARARSARTTACPSPRPAFTGSRSSTSGGCGLGIQHQRILPGQPAAERRARADAQDLEGGRHSPAARDAGRPAAGLQSLPAAVQRRAAAPASARSNARVAATVPRRARLHARLPPIEYPGHFLVKRITNAGHVPVQEAPALHRPRARAAHDRPRGSRRWHLVDSTSATSCSARLDERDYIIRG